MRNTPVIVLTLKLGFGLFQEIVILPIRKVGVLVLHLIYSFRQDGIYFVSNWGLVLNVAHVGTIIDVGTVLSWLFGLVARRTQVLKVDVLPWRLLKVAVYYLHVLHGSSMLLFVSIEPWDIHDVTL